MKVALALFTFTFCIFSFQFSNAQNIGIGTNNPHASAALDVTSTNSGLLPPRMTFAQRNAIANPVAGLIIYCSDCSGGAGEMNYYNGETWINMTLGVASNIVANLPSITIGTQIWSSKNLSVSNYRNGDPIPQVTDPTEWVDLTTGAWCWYNNDSATYAANYGRLYNWYAVNDPRGLAPEGWHVPTNAEWRKLVKFIDTGADTTCSGCYHSTIAGGALKTTNRWNYPNIGATNSSGFSGLPCGFRDFEGVFGEFGFYGYWWSASSFNTLNGWMWSLSYNNSKVASDGTDNHYGFSVRVIRD